MSLVYSLECGWMTLEADLLNGFAKGSLNCPLRKTTAFQGMFGKTDRFSMVNPPFLVEGRHDTLGIGCSFSSQRLAGLSM